MLDETSITKCDSNEMTGSEPVPSEFHAGDKQQTNSTIIKIRQIIGLNL